MDAILRRPDRPQTITLATCNDCGQLVAREELMMDPYDDGWVCVRRDDCQSRKEQSDE